MALAGIGEVINHSYCEIVYELSGRSATKLPTGLAASHEILWKLSKLKDGGTEMSLISNVTRVEGQAYSFVAITW